MARYRHARDLIETEASRIASQFAGEEDSVWRWAEANVLLQARATSQPGRYDSSWIPYVRDWQDDFSSPYVRRIVIVKGGQMGGTESLLNMMRYAIARDPGPTLWVMPSEGLGRSFSETRLQPSLYDCEATKEQIPSDPDKFKLLEYQLRDAVVNIVGSNSPANLASRPIRYLFGDELDKWAAASDKEAGALELARVRLATFWNSKEVLTSTPTTARGSIWQQFLLGDQRRLHVPCPLCGHRQVLVWSGSGKGVKWPSDERTKNGKEWKLDAVEALTYYECESCHGAIPQSARREMVAKGQWVAGNASAPKDIRSYQINALASPFDKHGWGKLAARFLQAHKTIGGLQDFCNSVLAEPWEEQEAEVEENALHDRRGEYGAGDEWADEIVDPTNGRRARFMGCDVQQDMIYWRCRMFGPGGASRGHGWGRVFTFAELEEVRLRLGVHPKMVMIDSGFNATEVYRACALYGWKPTKGQDKEHFVVEQAGQRVRQVWMKSKIDPHSGTAQAGRTQPISLYLFADQSLQDMLHLQLSGKAGAWTFEHDAGAEYVAQVCAEQKTADPKTGEIKWRTIRRNNHLRDCEKELLLAAIASGTLRL